MLTHVLPEIDRPEVREAIVRRIGSVFGGRVIWGEDLMQIEIEPGGVRTASS